MISAYFPLGNVLLRGDAKILNFESACYSKSVSIPLKLQVATCRSLNLFMAFLLNPLEIKTQTQVVQETIDTIHLQIFYLLNVFDNMNSVSCRFFN